MTLTQRLLGTRISGGAKPARRSWHGPVLIVAAVLAASTPSRAQTPQVGLEVDALPYVMGGWYAAGWWGVDRVRLRAVASDVDLPDFTIRGDFDRGESRAYALLVDYFPAASLRGPWIGGGIERWRNRIRHPAETPAGHYTNWMATVGGGWVFNLGRHFYLNPWAAGHLRVGGAETAVVGSRIYEIPKGLGEASIKLGVRF
jgi:hypothetical protein